MDAEKILSVEDDRVVTVKGKKITVWDINDDFELEERSTIDLPEKIVKNTVTTDTASDWLFVYESNEQNKADELKYSINVETGDVRSQL